MTLQILIWSVNVKFGAFLTLDALLFSALLQWLKVAHSGLNLPRSGSQ